MWKNHIMILEDIVTIHDMYHVIQVWNKVAVKQQNHIKW